MKKYSKADRKKCENDLVGKAELVNDNKTQGGGNGKPRLRFKSEWLEGKMISRF